jgi:PAS domain S-box-containing protein
MAPPLISPALEFSVALEPSHLLRARERLRDYLQLHCADDKLVADMVLCLEEACTNAIRHSGASDEMQIALHFEGDDLIAAVVDHGHGFDIDGFDPEAVPDPLKSGGRGLFIIAHLMDEMNLCRDDGLTVRMIKRSVARCRPHGLESGLGEDDSALAHGTRQTRMRALLDELDEAFLALDWEYRYVYANQAALRLLGKSREDLIGRTPYETWPDLAGTEVETRYREAMELGRPSVIERFSPIIDSWLERRIYPTPSGISVYIREINERKHKEQERERLLEEQKRVAELNEALNAINAAASAEPESPRLMNVLRLAGEAFGCDAGSVVVRDGDRWTRTHVWNMPTDFVRQQLDDEDMPYADLAVNERRPVLMEDFRNAPLSNAELAERLNVGATLAIPLIVDAKGFGCLFFTHAQPHTYSDIEVDFARKTGAVVSHALENARLYKAEIEARQMAQRELALSNTLIEAAAAQSSRLHLTDLLDSLIESILTLTGRARVVVHAVDDERRELTVLAARGRDLPPVGTVLGYDVLSPIAQQAMAERRMQVLDYDTAPDPQSSSCDAHLVLSVPLLVDDRLIGHLAVDTPGERAPFGEREIQLVEGMASRAAAAIGNARLIEELRVSREGERFLADMVECAGVPFSVGTADGRLVFFNRAFAVLTGYRRQELEERQFTWDVDLTPQEWRDRESKSLAEAVSEHRSVLYEKEYLRKDGSRVPVELFVQPFFDDAGQLLRFCGFATDITKRKQAEAERDRLVASLRAQREELRARTADMVERIALAEALNTVNALVHSTLDIDQIMQSTLEHGIGALNADACAIVMRVEDAWVVAYQGGFSQEAVGMRLSDIEVPSAAGIAPRLKPFAIADLVSGPPVDVGLAHTHGLRSALDVPLVARGSEVGRLLVYDKTTRVFSDAEEDFALKLGATVSLALENARLIEGEREAARLSVTLNEIHTLIHSTLDADVIMQRIVAVAATAVGADSVMIALKHGDNWVAEYGYPPVPGVIKKSVRTDEAPFMATAVTERRPIAINDCETDPRCLPEVQARFGVRAVLCVPLIVRDKVFGAVLFNQHAAAAKFEPRTITFAEQLAAAMWSALENASLYAAQQRIATTLQESLIHPLPDVTGVELGTVSQTAYEPELVGGDFSEVFELADGRVAVLIGDVAGKGIKAAGLTETVRSTVRAFAIIDSSPTFILARTNEALARYDEDEPHVTAFLLVLDPQTGHALYASAGHPARSTWAPAPAARSTSASARSQQRPPDPVRQCTPETLFGRLPVALHRRRHRGAPRPGMLR